MENINCTIDRVTFRMTWLLTKENPKSLVLDHPSEAGFYIINEETE